MIFLVRFQLQHYRADRLIRNVKKSQRRTTHVRTLHQSHRSSGSDSGNVEAVEKVDIKKEAKLAGDIKTSRIWIEDGAYFKGSIDIAKVTATKPAQENAAPASVASVSAAAAGSPG